MKKLIAMSSLAACLVLSNYAADTVEAPKESAFKSDKEKNGYIIGAKMAQNLIRDFSVGEEVEAADMITGFKDAMPGGKLQLSQQDLDDSFTQLLKSLNTVDRWKKRNEAFLTANAKKEGVVTTKSGLQYKIITDGKGPQPTESDSVNALYKGSLINGMEFDSTASRGNTPANFKVGGVIKGWTEALLAMKTGSKWQLFIPADLAYGERPPSPKIPPGSVLVFELELVDIGPPKPPSPHANGNNQQVTK